MIGQSPALDPIAAVTPTMFKAIDQPRRRLLGISGWLMTEPAFLEQVRDLKNRWQELPSESRPAFPLGRPMVYGVPPEDGIVAEMELNRFVVDLVEFLDRWGLQQMATWDIPVPQGPLLPNQLPIGSPATPKHGVHVYLPIHYPIQEKDYLVQQILDFQRQAARRLQIDESFAGIAHSEIYGKLFEIIHLETAIRSRIGSDESLYGRMQAVEEAIAKSVHIGIDTLQSYRKAIARCRAGGRSKVRILRVHDAVPNRAGERRKR
jgi:hypothetical protein